MKKFGTFGKILAGLVIVIIICLATRRLWGRAAWAGIEWICSSLGVQPPQGLKALIDVENLTGSQGTTTTP